MDAKRPYIGFDLTDKSQGLKQSVCRMLNAAVKYEERAVPMYQNINGQMIMADIDVGIRDQLKSLIPNEEVRRKKLMDIAREVGCEIYYK